MSEAKEKFQNSLIDQNYVATKNYRSSKKSAIDDPGTINPLVTTSPVISHYQDDITNRRIIKAAWQAAYAKSSNWLDNIEKVFWLGWVNDIDLEMLPIEVDEFLDAHQGTNGDEFSCVGYPNGISHVEGWTQLLGFEIQGKPTYAVQKDAWSQEGWRIHPKVRQWYKDQGSRGVPRRPMSLKLEDLVSHAVFEPKDLRPGWENVVGEIIVDNWIIKGIVINEAPLLAFLDLDPEFNRECIEWISNLENLYPQFNITRINKTNTESINLYRWHKLAGLLKD